MTRITQYDIRLNPDKTAMLVKEKAVNYEPGGAVDSPKKAVDLLTYLFNPGTLAQEHFYVIALGPARRAAGVFDVTSGTLMSCLVHPREVFQRLLLCGAASFIAAHNHPSGRLDISDQDIEVTNRLRNAGELMGIHLDDHLIIADQEFVSCR